jgi:hypothetical protein
MEHTQHKHPHLEQLLDQTDTRLLAFHQDMAELFDVRHTDLPMLAVHSLVHLFSSVNRVNERAHVAHRRVRPYLDETLVSEYLSGRGVVLDEDVCVGCAPYHYHSTLLLKKQ